MEIKNIILSDYIRVYDNCLPEEILNSFINICEEHDGFHSAAIGENTVNKKIRKADVWQLSNLGEKSMTTIHWANLFTSFFQEKLMEYSRFFSSNKFDSIRPHLSELSVLRYKETFHYLFHTDQSQWINRQWSCIYLLNDNYEGGDLIFATPDGVGEKKIKKKKNTMIIWPSNFMYPHTITPVSKGIRFSLVAWAK